jgi:hypothetical protein
MHGSPRSTWAWTLVLMALLQAPQRTTARHPCPPGYEAFGPSTVPLGGAVGQVYGNMRAFIWLHWHEHRPGCATLTYTSPPEFVTCTEAYTIGPDKAGRWHIDEDLTCGPGGRGNPPPTSATSTWYYVQRVPQGSTRGPQHEALPDSAELPGSSYFLRLRDLSGRKEGRL